MNLADETVMTPLEVDPMTASREWWSMYHTYRRIRAKETRPDDPVFPDEAFEAQMKRADPFNHNRVLSIIDGDRIVSSVIASAAKPTAPGYESNRHLISVAGAVVKGYRRRGIGRAWLPVVVRLMDEYGCTVATSSTDEDDGHAFLSWIGAEGKQAMAENRLDFSRVDWDMVRRWIEDGQARSPGTNLILYPDGVPRAVWGELSPVFSELANMMPFDELDHGEIVITPEMIGEWYARLAVLKGEQYTAVTREPDGTISGVTQLMYLPQLPGFLNQGFTGVSRKARGRGLGKWLKAAMLEHVRSRYPDTQWVKTGNANSNDPMLAINRQLGFREFKSGITYQISRIKLEEAVARGLQP